MADIALLARAIAHLYNLRRSHLYRSITKRYTRTKPTVVRKCLYQLPQALFFSVPVTDHRGKVKKTYPYQDVMTPYEKFKSLPAAQLIFGLEKTQNWADSFPR